MKTWRRMDSAPRDGTWIIGAHVSHVGDSSAVHAMNVVCWDGLRNTWVLADPEFEPMIVFVNYWTDIVPFTTADLIPEEEEV